jgi:hypothetical protein
MRTIIAGSRSACSMLELEAAVRKCGWQITSIISGGARGADRLGEQWAWRHGIPLEVFPADWDKWGKSAGYIRNEQMANKAEALIALWDGESLGTAHMIRQAEVRRLQVYIELVL